MAEIITPYQNAFIKGRSIADNIILGSEIINVINRKRKGKWSIGALKLDMDKAYDRLSWKFIKIVMKCMGFNKHWVDLIQEYIGMMNYHLLINEAQTGTITPQRGLRQGDPLSPYIFILCQNIVFSFPWSWILKEFSWY